MEKKFHIFGKQELKEWIQEKEKLLKDIVKQLIFLLIMIYNLHFKVMIEK